MRGGWLLLGLLWTCAAGAHTHNSKLQPVVSEADGYRDYRWDAQNIAATKADKGAPEWFNPYAAVQWTEFDDCASVVQWSLPLYQTPRAPGPALHDEIARIRRECSSAAGRTAAVLQLVQRDVRYLGIEVGPGSHAPTAACRRRCVSFNARCCRYWAGAPSARCWPGWCR